MQRIRYIPIPCVVVVLMLAASCADYEIDPCAKDGLTSCSRGCVDLGNDDHNCGVCGNACVENAYCAYGKCRCVLGYTDCSGTCMNLNWDPKNCGDCGNVCESGGECVWGVCGPVSECAEDAECEDGLYCTGDESCENGVCSPGTPVDCDDRDTCTEDTCNEETDECEHILQPSPGAEGPPGDESCGDSIDNDCDMLTDIMDMDCCGCLQDSDCDDRNSCTRERCIDCSCIPELEPDGTPCDDGDHCSSQDVCQDGVCTAGPTDKDSDGDGYIDDQCPDGDDCDDSNSDVNPDAYEGPMGAAICLDGIDNNCDGLTDTQAATCCDCDFDAACSDNDYCNGIERCVDCMCVLGTPPDCDDGNQCTDDYCDAINECQHEVNTDRDDDGYDSVECGGDDCDDNDRDVNPGIIEDSTSRFVCSDDLDNDCDGLTDHDEPGCCIPDCTDVECGDGGCSDQPTVCGECEEGFWCNNGVCEEFASEIVWVFISGGTFMMGSDDGYYNEQPVHQVSVGDFYMMMTEVTVSQYEVCVQDGGCYEPHSPGCDEINWGVAGRADHPVNCVGWDQALQFCTWAGGRLPSEAEWEYAARSGGLDIDYPWGNQAPTCDYAVLDEDGVEFNGNEGCDHNRTWPVCSKPAGNTDQGLCDMVGNVYEWVRDYYHSSYVGAPTDGSAWEDPVGSNRVIRGGSWASSPQFLRASFREWDLPIGWLDIDGFRCARDAE